MKLNQKQILTYSGLAVLVILVGSLAVSYFTSFRDPITVFFKRLYPVALIEGRIISINDLELAGIVGQRLGLDHDDAENKFIETEKSYALARKLNLSISNDLAADEMRFYLKGNESEYQNLLSTVFGTEHFFYKYVVNPQVVDAQLRMKYYSEKKDTSAAYKEAQAVLVRLSKGEKFEDLAKQTSDDKTTGQIGGDLGFYEAGQLLPELEDQISISPLSEFRKDIIISRLGYHLVYPVEHVTVDGKKMWHAKHMLFAEPGFDEWLRQQTKNISVNYLR